MDSLLDTLIVKMQQWRKVALFTLRSFLPQHLKATQQQIEPRTDTFARIPGWSYPRKTEIRISKVGGGATKIEDVHPR